MADILIVDDSATIRMLLSAELKNAGHNVTVAISGEEALDKLRDLTPQLIITDLNMPGINGLELIEKVRKKEAISLIPILILTTEDNPEKKAQGRAVGATGWIIKPFKRDKLLFAVDRLTA
ncbi:response regulator [Gluconobacter wancherniae]|uniref:Two-component system response regulator n=1 Tax=Gluconobacter wancherniae NBRC 103581 TaxID=656744 RepID=A0A511B110_9PROT|nr:response regulator [Gluconobacter wancherniae]GBD57082.1 Fis family transcriptional regulator [Gluconobacter wancherniae NBRC 103581]GBR65140.1 chemotaxis protein CheY [Gluconobacter wancherniae NBRC 103581]GEK94149.1 two-component system response regulator [Gluconobacter wancherniae NBRC 103581]